MGRIKKEIRVHEFLKIVEQNNTIPTRDNEILFEDGVSAGIFWSLRSKFIKEELSKPENKKKYPKAYKMIIEGDLKTFKNINRIYNLFNDLENGKNIPLFYTKTSKEDISRRRFFINNSEEIYRIISEDKNKKKYPIAYSKILLLHDYFENDFKFKLKELLELLEKDNLKIIELKKKKFQDGTNAYSFLMNNREKVINNYKKYEDIYPKACKIISNYKDKKTNKKRLYIFFEVVDKIDTELNINNRKLFTNDDIKTYWYQFKNEIYSEIQKEENKEKYPNAYKKIINVYENYQNKKDEKINTLIKIIEKEKRMPKNSDKRLFDDDTSIGAYWNNNMEKIVKAINKQKDDYPIAHKIINDTYNNIMLKRNTDKFKEYFEIIESENKKPPHSDRRLFSDNSLVGTFWVYSKERIYNEIIKEENKKKYPKAYKILTESYNKNKELTERIEEYIKYVDKNNKIPTDITLTLSTGEKMYSFKNRFKEEIYEEVNKEKNKEKYPNAHKLITFKYEQYKEKVKYKTFFEIVEKEGKIPPSDDERTFDDNTKLGYFYFRHRDEIFNEINKKENKEKYKKAYEVINYAYNVYLFKNDNSKDDEFINILNNLTYLPKVEDNILFKDGKNIRYYWEANRNTLRKIITKQKDIYKNAYDIINNIDVKYKDSKKHERNNIYIFIKYTEELGSLPFSIENINGINTRDFWEQKKFIIFNVVSLMKQEYKKAYIIIKNEIESVLKTLDYSIFYDILEKENKLPTQRDNRKLYDIIPLYDFWYLNRVDLIERIQDKKEKYPNAYNILNKYKIKRTTSRKKRKTTADILVLCYKYKVNIKKYDKLIEHISYEEFVAKSIFLKDNNIPIATAGNLHEIFTMSSLNMKQKYGYTTEEIIMDYYSEYRKGKIL